MTTFSIKTNAGFSMNSAFALSNAKTILNTATGWIVKDTVTGANQRWYGTGFTYDANNQITGGLATKMVSYDATNTVQTITEFSTPWNFSTQGASPGSYAGLLSGDDSIIGGTGNDVLSGGSETNVNGVHVYNGHSYLLSNAGTWADAQAQAQSLGGNLVTINDQSEQNWLTDTFLTTEDLWIGYTDQDTEGVYKWISGETSSYTHWNAGEPNDRNTNTYQSEDYAHLWGSDHASWWGFDFGYWNDLVNDFLPASGIIEINNINTGEDTLKGGKGNDTYLVNSAGDKIIELLNEGTDTVKSSITYKLTDNVENLTLTGAEKTKGLGNNLNNSITGNSASNILIGYDGNDKLNGGAGADSMYGGLGNDTYYVNNTADYISESSDTVNGGLDTVISTVSRSLGNYQENLTLAGILAINGYGNSLNNKIVGNVANNVINGGAGTDSMYGGFGNDTYYIDNKSDYIGESSDAAKGGIDTVVSKISYTLGNYQENLTLSGTSTINGLGNSLSNVINGNDLKNILIGYGGNDKLSGGGGDDLLAGGTGNDVIFGGANTDTASYSGASTGYKLSYLANNVIKVTDTDLTNGNDGTDTLTGIEKLKFSDKTAILNSEGIFDSVGYYKFFAMLSSAVYLHTGIGDEPIPTEQRAFELDNYQKIISTPGFHFLTAQELGIAPAGDTATYWNDGINNYKTSYHYDFKNGFYGTDASLNPASAFASVGATQDALFVTFRGTDQKWDWVTDLFSMHQQYAMYEALTIAIDKYLATKPNTTVYVSGHSLGGQMATLYMNEHFNDSRYIGVEFEAANKLMTNNQNELLPNHNPNIVNIEMPGDPVPDLGLNRGDVIHVEFKDENGIQYIHGVFADHPMSEVFKYIDQIEIQASRNPTSDITLNLYDRAISLQNNPSIINVQKSVYTQGGSLQGSDTFIIKGSDGQTYNGSFDELILNNPIVKNIIIENDTFSPSENVNYFADPNETNDKTITGNFGNNNLSGGAGHDILSGSKGVDVLHGLNGNDRLYGGTGNDKLYGDAGNDFLDGGANQDILYGGTGSDTFRFWTVADANGDKVMDFQVGTDKIDLSKIDALSDSLLFPSWDGKQSLYYSKTNLAGKQGGFVFFDDATHSLKGYVDLGSTADFSITLTGVSKAQLDSIAESAWLIT